MDLLWLRITTVSKLLSQNLRRFTIPSESDCLFHSLNSVPATNPVIVAIRNSMPYRNEEFRNMLLMSSSEFFDVFEIQADAVPESELAAPAGLTPSDAPVIFMKCSLFM